ncbi:MAG: transcription elongation factor GreA [bacterium]|nr:transcription elongation factor GreA [bacterium]
MANEVVLTSEGRDKLLEELHYLETEKRAEIGERIRVAREFGDISENSEYDDAKNEQAQMESRIAEINQILANAQIISTPRSSSKVSVGLNVEVLINGVEEKTLSIVGAAEANSLEGKISNESPVGSALIGKKKGDEVEVVGPTGKRNTFKIIKISK